MRCGPAPTGTRPPRGRCPVPVLSSKKLVCLAKGVQTRNERVQTHPTTPQGLASNGLHCCKGILDRLPTLAGPISHVRFMPSSPVLHGGPKQLQQAWVAGDLYFLKLVTSSEQFSVRLDRQEARHTVPSSGRVWIMRPGQLVCLVPAYMHSLNAQPGSFSL